MTTMHKTALLAALLLAVSAPAAMAKSKKADKAMDVNEASWRFVRDSVPLWLPSYAIPVYLAVKGDLDKNRKK